MSHPTVLAGALAAVVLLAAARPGARAADLDYPYGALQSPVLPETKVEFGTGWYVRGDIAAKDDTNVVTLARESGSSEAFGVLKAHRLGYDLSLGGGYAFVNGLRADVVADFHQPTAVSQPNQPCIPATAATCSVYGKFESYDVLVNAYYDFGTWYRVTPYVGAGVGVAFGEVNARLDGSAAGTYFGKYDFHNLAFAVMAGIAIDVYDHVKLDLGYRYLNNGTVGGARVDFQEARAGLRYVIDK